VPERDYMTWVLICVVWYDGGEERRPETGNGLKVQAPREKDDVDGLQGYTKCTDTEDGTYDGA